MTVILYHIDVRCYHYYHYSYTCDDGRDDHPDK